MGLKCRPRPGRAPDRSPRPTATLRTHTATEYVRGGIAVKNSGPVRAALAVALVAGEPAT